MAEIEKFYNLTDYKAVLELATTIKLPVLDISIENYYKAITFDQSEAKIKPVFWCQFLDFDEMEPESSSESSEEEDERDIFRQQIFAVNRLRRRARC
jgi:hypothetical protein